MAPLEFDHDWWSRSIAVDLSEQAKSHRFRELLTVLWDNRKQLPYAWDILKHGVCDGCSLGPYGLRDNVLDGLHLCMKRLKALKLNTMPALDIAWTADLHRLRSLGVDQLRSLGRLAYPMVRRNRQPGFCRASWEEALELVRKSIHDTAPHEMAFFATAAGLTNEAYYAFQKLARVMGTNNIDLCSRSSHAAAVAGLKSTLGYAASTCSLSDMIGTELLVLFSADLADNQPVLSKYLRYAKQAGTRIVVVNSTAAYRIRPSWTPSSSPKSEAQSAHHLLQIQAGGEIALMNGVLKTLIANDQLDRRFIDKQTARFDRLRDALENQSWEMLEQRSGLTRMQMQQFAAHYGAARSAVFVYDIGLVRDQFARDNVQALVNLALARGMIGREKCGIMAIRGHSGVQGSAECGIAPDRFPGGFAVNEDTARRFSNLWHHPVPANAGLNSQKMIAAAHAGNVRFLYTIGGNLFDTEADVKFMQEALGRIAVRIHHDTALNPSMLLDADQAVVLLPGQTRYEQRTGGTSTSTERRIRFTPEISGRRIGETLPDWEILAFIGRKSMPNGDKLFPFNDSQAIRDEMSRVMPIYHGVEKLTKEGDQLQWGGPQLYSDGFTLMPANRALFTALTPPEQREFQNNTELWTAGA